MEYQHASDDFERFLHLLRDRSGLATRNQAYTVAQAVLMAFRRRMTVREGLAFATCLPPILRAIFVADWDTDVPARPFTTRSDLMADVLNWRRDHNFATSSSIGDVVVSLEAAMSSHAHADMLANLPEAAKAFWST
jgi:uncharacterized protein (DUF2267 family)